MFPQANISSNFDLKIKKFVSKFITHIASNYITLRENKLSNAKMRSHRDFKYHSYEFQNKSPIKIGK